MNLLNLFGKSKRAANAFACVSIFSILGIAAPDARAAKGDIDVVVASDRTEAGKKFTPPTAKNPAYCIVLSAGPNELGAVFAGEKIPPQKDVEPFVIKALAAQHYLPVNDEHPEPSLVVVYSWGSINPDEMDGFDDDAPKQILNQKQMLSIVVTRHVDLSPNSIDRSFLPDLSDGRYFLLVGAYDFAALKQGKRVMLWRTRLSTYNTGVELFSAIPMMLDVGAKSFGSDGLPDELVAKAKKGRVIIGEAQVTEYIPESKEKAGDKKGDKKK